MFKWYVRLRFAPNDFFVGFFWHWEPRDADPRLRYWSIYICPIPCFHIHVFQAIPF